MFTSHHMPPWDNHPVRRIPLVTLRGATGGMQPTAKRTVQVNVKMTREDFDLLKEAAHTYWPDAVLSNSGIVLGLAKMASRDILKRGSTKRSIRH